MKPSDETLLNVARCFVGVCSIDRFCEAERRIIEILKETGFVKISKKGEVEIQPASKWK